MALTREERFLNKVDKTDTCWLWVGAIGSEGYGNFWDGTRTMKAHRWSYLYYVGDIPSDKVLDHLCRTRHCVNPEHLEPVSNALNTIRGMIAVGIIGGEKPGTCKRGHSWEEHTAINTRGYRYCRKCMTDRARELYQLERQREREHQNG